MRKVVGPLEVELYSEDFTSAINNVVDVVEAAFKNGITKGKIGYNVYIQGAEHKSEVMHAVCEIYKKAGWRKVLYCPQVRYGYEKSYTVFTFIE